MLYSHFTQNCIFLYFLEAKNPCFVTKNCSKSSYICVFILSKKQHNWFYKNLHNSGMVGRRKLPDPSLNFNALSIGVQYTLSFEWTNFGLKCLYDSKSDWNKATQLDKTMVSCCHKNRRKYLNAYPNIYSRENIFLLKGSSTIWFNYRNGDLEELNGLIKNGSFAYIPGEGFSWQ